MIQKRNRDEQPEVLEFKEDSVRKSILDNGLRSYAVSGYMVETKNDFDAIITKQNRINHVLHFFLLAPTCGFWIIPWIYLTIVNKNPERHAFWVDEYGRMQIKKLNS
jgi:hypothetical protein